VITGKKTYGCNDCPKLKKDRCLVWEVKVKDPYNSSCESIMYWINRSHNQAVLDEQKDYASLSDGT
jgi:hypothetical protein